MEDRSKKLFGVEIKYSASLTLSDFNGLKRLADFAGKKFQKGIVLYTGEQVLGGFGGKNLHAIRWRIYGQNE